MSPIESHRYMAEWWPSNNLHKFSLFSMRISEITKQFWRHLLRRVNRRPFMRWLLEPFHVTSLSGPQEWCAISLHCRQYSYFDLKTSLFCKSVSTADREKYFSCCLAACTERRFTETENRFACGKFIAYNTVAPANVQKSKRNRSVLWCNVILSIHLEWMWIVIDQQWSSWLKLIQCK